MIKKVLEENRAFFLVLAGFLVVSLMMFCVPIVGIADNGDFGKIINGFGFAAIVESAEDMFFNFTNRLYSVSEVGSGEIYTSSVSIFIVIAKVLHSIFDGGNVFDIRYLGFVYMVAYIGAFVFLYSLLKKCMKNKVIVPLIVFTIFLTNVGYLVYFNSFYLDAAGFVFFLYFVCLGLRLVLKCEEKLEGFVDYLLFMLFAFLFALTKAENYFVVLIAILFVLYTTIRYKRRVFMNCGNIVIGVCLFFVVAHASEYNERFEKASRFNSIFDGVLKNSLDKEGALSQLGISSDYLRLEGYGYYNGDISSIVSGEGFESDVMDKITYSNIVKFYLGNPRVFLNVMAKSAENAFDLQVKYLGNYEKTEGGIPRKQIDIWHWPSVVEKGLNFNSLGVLSVLFLCMIVITLYEMRVKENRGYCIFYLMVIVISMIVFITPVIRGGETELDRSMVMFNYTFDFLLASLIVYLYKVKERFFKRAPKKSDEVIICK